MDLKIMDLPPCLRFCVIEVLQEYVESYPQNRKLANGHEGFIYVHEKFVSLEKALFRLGTSTAEARQRKAAAAVAAAALRILTDFADVKECEPCQKKRSTQSQTKKQTGSSALPDSNATG